MQQHDPASSVPRDPHTDVVIIGAGFGGVRLLIELKKLGLSAVALESGTNLGGTWYWNRYPGARTDSEAWSYAFPFEEIERRWNWSERYPGAAEVQKYIAFVADHFDVRRNIRLSHRVTSAHFDNRRNVWSIVTDSGARFTCTYFIPALGHLTIPHEPKFAGLESYKGETYLTSRWPHEDVSFAGKRVAVIGTGASGIQAIPLIAAQAARVTVFQRTPNYVMPAQNHALDDEFRSKLKRESAGNWAMARSHIFGFPMRPAGRMFDDVTSEEERERIFEEGWQKGGFHFVFGTFDDLVLDQRSNDAAAEFIRRKIRQIVKDPATAELLTPRGYPYISKRPPSGSHYYETFNRENVELVDLRRAPIETFTSSGIRTSERTFEFDAVVFATGFDATTGAYEKIDIRGERGQQLREAWSAGPETYLGVGVPGFPNMLMLCGPQSPYINIPVAIEKIVDWLGKALCWMRSRGYDRIQPTREAAVRWSDLVDGIFGATLLPGGEGANSWYLGANIPGKPRRALFHFGGAAAYAKALDEVADKAFEGFECTSSRDHRVAEVAVG